MRENFKLFELLRFKQIIADCAIVRNFIIFTHFTPISQYVFFIRIQKLLCEFSRNFFVLPNV